MKSCTMAVREHKFCVWLCVCPQASWRDTTADWSNQRLCSPQSIW